MNKRANKERLEEIDRILAIIKIAWKGDPSISFCSLLVDKLSIDINSASDRELLASLLSYIKNSK